MESSDVFWVDFIKAALLTCLPKFSHYCPIVLSHLYAAHVREGAPAILQEYNAGELQGASLGAQYPRFAKCCLRSFFFSMQGCAFLHVLLHQFIANPPREELTPL